MRNGKVVLPSLQTAKAYECTASNYTYKLSCSRCLLLPQRKEQIMAKKDKAIKTSLFLLWKPTLCGHESTCKKYMDRTFLTNIYLYPFKFLLECSSVTHRKTSDDKTCFGI